MNLRRDEIAFRSMYLPYVENESLTTVFRPGNRIFPNWRGYKKGEIVTARIIEIPGDDSKYIAPTFNEIQKIVIINDIEVVNINDLTNYDFDGSSEDVRDIQSLKKHLSQIYNYSSEYLDNAQITRISLYYVS